MMHNIIVIVGHKHLNSPDIHANTITEKRILNSRHTILGLHRTISKHVLSFEDPSRSMLAKFRGKLEVSIVIGFLPVTKLDHGEPLPHTLYSEVIRYKITKGVRRSFILSLVTHTF